MPRCNRLLAALALACAPVPLPAQEAAAPPVTADRPPLALMGTIPIYWGEAAGIDELLSGSAQPHWARQVLEADHALVPLDYLSAEALSTQQVLLMAQPRGLSGEENVALDAWVRGGGHLLLVADPLMTGESRFAIGDRRRPQDVVLLSPILAHWGLELRFDEGQDDGPSMRTIAGQQGAVNMAGHFVALDGNAGACTLADDRLVARCSLGAGLVLLVADAAFLDLAGPSQGSEAVLQTLVREISGTAREMAPDSAIESPLSGENGANGGEIGSQDITGVGDSSP